MRLTLKALLTLSSAFATIALALPWAVSQFDANLAFETCTRVSFWLAVACLAFFIIGIVRFRSRGLWLGLPMVVAWAWTASFIWMWVGIMDTCAKTGRCP